MLELSERGYINYLNMFVSTVKGVYNKVYGIF